MNGFTVAATPLRIDATFYSSRGTSAQCCVLCVDALCSLCTKKTCRIRKKSIRWRKKQILKVFFPLVCGLFSVDLWTQYVFFVDTFFTHISYTIHNTLQNVASIPILSFFIFRQRRRKSFLLKKLYALELTNDFDEQEPTNQALYQSLHYVRCLGPKDIFCKIILSNLCLTTCQNPIRY